MPLTHIFIDATPRVRESAVTHRFLARYPNAKHIVVPDAAAIDAHIPPSEERAARALFLTEQQGVFFDRCPGTKYFICCNYFVIDFAFQCPFRCAYCFLRFYDNAYITKVFTNTETLIGEVARKVSPNTFYRIGTGEVTDSLVYDDLTGVSRMLMEALSPYPRVFLELKTKSANVDHLLPLPSRLKERTVIAFSVNPQSVIARYEEGAASLDERIAAAIRARDAGYRLAFHFDPIIRVDGWERAYEETVARIYEHVREGDVLWISMGGVRFLPSMEETLLREKKPGYDFILDEFIESEDGKMRYFRPLREALYRHVLSAIRARDKKVYVYLCMETPSMWDAVFGRPFRVKEFESHLLGDVYGEHSHTGHTE